MCVETALPAENQHVEERRPLRAILPYISDYLQHIPGLTYVERVGYYRMLKEDLGIHTVRVEFKMGHLMNSDDSVNHETRQRYLDSLRAINEAGLSNPIIYLHRPSKKMEKQAKKDPGQFYQLFRKIAQETKAICQEAGVFPQYLQVMSEINTRFQTQFSLPLVVQMIDIADSVFSDHPQTKLMTTILCGEIAGDWRAYTAQLVQEARALKAVGFDHYPGSYNNPAGIPLVGKPPHEAFADITPFKWIASEKTKRDGILYGKDILIAETGVPALFKDSVIKLGENIVPLPFNEREQRYGYDIIVRELDRFLLPLEKQGSVNIFQGIGFFSAAELDPKAIGSTAPWALDATPWTLLRQQMQKLGKGNTYRWRKTPAAKRLKTLIETLIYPPKKSDSDDGNIPPESEGGQEIDGNG
ncbi:hypothetical protein A2960_05695 [Candidatus Gottesmanbacteria bacterium RIFCSPLOWO2_01_FULL_39_12b]|uniref:Uncharacterized protein n=1 Tax=Candidatus Gottesmanbacteria bacterium RIFCSPLOWO2_01_FULL_39_12b TaxID=1798388 RepID=A0A1F6AMU3_9BACT|nr:MAG: hypothetical protein A2960_05695 [Candidatus Gottesmanbacteria bacterium RIFCSPLOWO2_01_FULL_39_12b]